MGEIHLIPEKYTQIACFDHTVREDLSLTELETIKRAIENELKTYLSFEGSFEQESLMDYLDIRRGAKEKTMTVSVRISEIDKEKIELFIIGRNKCSQQIRCTFFVRIFIRTAKFQHLTVPCDALLRQDFEHREYKRRMRAKISLLFNK